MKKLFFLIAISLSFSLKAQTEFITVWNPSITYQGVTFQNYIDFPVNANDYWVYWEEVGYPFHNGYFSPGPPNYINTIYFGFPNNPVWTDAKYRVKLYLPGSVTSFQFSDVQNWNLIGATKLIDIEQWGNIKWTSLWGAFGYCTSLTSISATDKPDLSLCSSVRGMFSHATNFTGNASMSTWVTDNVTNMSQMFEYTKFNQNISNWNVRNVKTMAAMFYNDTVFNQNLGLFNLAGIQSGGLALMLSNTAMSCQNYDATLQAWRNNVTIPSNLNLGAAGRKYTSYNATNARNYLITNKGWSFSGDTYDPNCYLATTETNKTHLKIFPNPTSDFINISTDAKIISAELFDASGKIVLKSTNKKINISALPKGNYFLKVKTENSEQTQKILKQ